MLGRAGAGLNLAVVEVRTGHSGISQGPPKAMFVANCCLSSIQNFHLLIEEVADLPSPKPTKSRNMYCIRICTCGI